MQVNPHDAKTHPSRYVAHVFEGHELIIAKAGRPLVRLVPPELPAQGRRGGFLRDTAVIEVDLKGELAFEIDVIFG